MPIVKAAINCICFTSKFKILKLYVSFSSTISCHLDFELFLKKTCWYCRFCCWHKARFLNNCVYSFTQPTEHKDMHDCMTSYFIHVHSSELNKTERYYLLKRDAKYASLSYMLQKMLQQKKKKRNSFFFSFLILECEHPCCSWLRWWWCYEAIFQTFILPSSICMNEYERMHHYL